MIDTNRRVIPGAVTTDGQRPRFASLLLDSCGTIVKGSRAAAAMFRAKPWMLEYTAIRSRIAELSLSPASPGYNVRRMAYLSSDGRWHRFQGVDVLGRPFTVELFVSRTTVVDRPLFLLKLRLPDVA